MGGSHTARRDRRAVRSVYDSPAGPRVETIICLPSAQSVARSNSRARLRREDIARMPDPTTIFLVRHGQTDWIAHGIAGRLPDVHLNAQGREQAARLVERMRYLPLGAIYSSPLERTQETAAPLARALGLDVRTCPE